MNIQGGLKSDTLLYAL